MEHHQFSLTLCLYLRNLKHFLRFCQVVETRKKCNVFCFLFFFSKKGKIPYLFRISNVNLFLFALSLTSLLVPEVLLSACTFLEGFFELEFLRSDTLARYARIFLLFFSFLFLFFFMSNVRGKNPQETKKVSDLPNNCKGTSWTQLRLLERRRRFELHAV